MKINNILILLIILLGIYLLSDNNGMIVYPKEIRRIEIIAEDVDNRFVRLFPEKEINFFETDKDIKNWFIKSDKNGGIEVKRSNRYFSQGNYSMQISWKTKEWGELIFVHFPEDWNNYQNFNFDIFNSNNEEVGFQLRIGDKYDATGFYHKAGKFVMKNALKSGWNTFSLKIGDIGNEINTFSERKVIHLRFFTQDSTLYLDNMRLEA